MQWSLEKIRSCTYALINNFEILQVSIAFFSDTVRPRNLKFFLYINPYKYSMQTKFHVPRSDSFRKKCDEILKLASNFSLILWDRGTWNFFCILTHLDTLCQIKFHVSRSQSFREKCDDHLKLASHFFPILFYRGTWNFFCILTHMDTLCKPNFMLLGHTVFREKCNDMLQKSRLHTFALINNFEILQVSIAFFSDNVRPRNLKFVLYINPYKYSMQTKFHVPRSHSFREKCDDNLHKFKVAHSP